MHMGPIPAQGTNNRSHMPQLKFPHATIKAPDPPAAPKTDTAKWISKYWQINNFVKSSQGGGLSGDCAAYAGTSQGDGHSHP